MARGPHVETFWKNEGYSLDVGVTKESGIGFSSFGSGR